MIKKEGMGRGEDDRSHFLGEAVARISVDDSGEQARAHSQRRRTPSNWKSLFARRDEIKNKPEQSALHERPRLPMLS